MLRQGKLVPPPDTIEDVIEELCGNLISRIDISRLQYGDVLIRLYIRQKDIARERETASMEATGQGTADDELSTRIRNEIDILRTGDTWEKELAVNALVEIGASAVKLLTWALHDKDIGVMELVKRALVEMVTETK